MNLKQKIKNLPNTPGIYLFYNSKKELIYVGKATDLKSRVGSYFRQTSPQPLLRKEGTTRPIEVMIHEVKDIKVIATDSVLEAIILEGKYIKDKKPKYNVDWKDDKSWNYIYITDNIYPQVATIREHELENSKFKIQNSKIIFGPYPGLKVKEMMRLLQKLFYISVCSPSTPPASGHLPSGRVGHKPCFYYQLGQCLGVCTGEITPQDYKRKVILPLIQFLKGHKKILLKNLDKKMHTESKNKNFEEAGRLRDQIYHLKKIQDIALLNKSFVNEEISRSTQNDRLGGRSNGRDFRIEGYDISNLGSSDKVGSMVVFENGEPQKSAYRKFNIKKVLGQSDVDCLAEVVERRLRHPEWVWPNVFLIDGGKPQVNRVKMILDAHNFFAKKSVILLGIAKGPKRNKNEFIFDHSNKSVVKFVLDHENLLIQVRDEAHRFAIKFNRQKRIIK